MIGIKILPLKKIKTKKGNIYKFLSRNDKFYKKFGEIYFTEIKKNSEKGWNFHTKNKCHISVIKGKVKFHFLKKNRKIFKSKKITLSSKNHKMIIIEPEIYFSFKGFDNFNLIANFLEKPHSKNESKKFEVVNNIKIK
jgi:hypothetical protein